MQKVCIFAHFFEDRNKEQKLYNYIRNEERVNSIC